MADGTVERDGPATARGTDAAPATTRPPGLLVWTFAAFHAAVLVTFGVLALHLVGSVGDLLAGLRTEVGVAVYLLLWTTTWWTTRRWLASAWPTGERAPSLAGLVGRAGVWGGANGVLFFGVVAAGVFLPNTLRAGADAVPVLVFLVLLGGLVAFAVGSVLGGLLALVDLACWRAAGWLVEPVT